jgi:hypothetical protein
MWIDKIIQSGVIELASLVAFAIAAASGLTWASLLFGGIAIRMFYVYGIRMGKQNLNKNQIHPGMWVEVEKPFTYKWFSFKDGRSYKYMRVRKRVRCLVINRANHRPISTDVGDLDTFLSQFDRSPPSMDLFLLKPWADKSENRRLYRVSEFGKFRIIKESQIKIDTREEALSSYRKEEEIMRIIMEDD